VRQRAQWAHLGAMHLPLLALKMRSHCNLGDAMTTTRTTLLEARLSVLSAAMTRILEALPSADAEQVLARVAGDLARLPGNDGAGEIDADVDAARAGELWRLLDRSANRSVVGRQSNYFGAHDRSRA
jgi:hypothetical protein